MSNAPSTIPRFLSAFDVAAALGCSYHAALKHMRAVGWLGHADVLTTMRYLRVVDDRHPGAKKLPW